MKLRLASPSDVIDLAALSELKGISVSGDAVTIGGGVTHYDVANSADVKKAIPALAELAGSIGDPAVRYRGTIGGSLANNDPSADYPSAALALGATIKTNQRTIPADSYFKGIFSTALADGEIITQVSFPIPAKAAYRKFLNPASRYAMAGVFVVRTKDGKVRVAVTGAGINGVYRANDMEAALEKKFAADAIAGVTVDKSKMLSDIHASAEYRANLVKVMATRAVAAIA
jgi:carbon-monoxide dehydrogenase medium subunit